MMDTEHFRKDTDLDLDDEYMFGRLLDEVELLNLTGLLQAASGPRSFDPFKEVLKCLNLYVTPAIIVIGILGNTLSLFVFSLTYLHRLSSTIYLSALSIADIGYLLGLLIVWLERTNLFLFRRNGWCQAVLYTTRVCGFLAVWDVVIFTTERYVTVYHPLKKDTFCKKRTAKAAVLALTVFALLFYTFVLWTHGVVSFFWGQSACGPLPHYNFLITIMTSVDTLISCIVPSTMILVLNLRIIVRIHRYQTLQSNGLAGGASSPTADVVRLRVLMQTSVSATGSMHVRFSSAARHCRDRTVTTGAPAGANGSSARDGALAREGALTRDSANIGLPNSEQVKRLVRGRSQFRTARMLLVISSVSVLLNLPTHVFRVQDFVQDLIGGGKMATRDRFNWQELFEMVYFLNFAINFFIYSACNSQFRLGLARLCRRLRRNLRRCLGTKVGCRIRPKWR